MSKNPQKKTRDNENPGKSTLKTFFYLHEEKKNLSKLLRPVFFFLTFHSAGMELSKKKKNINTEWLSNIESILKALKIWDGKPSNLLFLANREFYDNKIFADIKAIIIIIIRTGSACQETSKSIINDREKKKKIQRLTHLFSNFPMRSQCDRYTLRNPSPECYWCEECWRKHRCFLLSC